MTSLIWTTDLHWDRLDIQAREELFEFVREQNSHGQIISGDIGEAPCIVEYLAQLHERTGLPVYFVLGNHDFYFGSFAKVKEAVRQFACPPGYHWLTECSPISLTTSVALIGHEGWADARLGENVGATKWPRDFQHIEDFAGLNVRGPLPVLRVCQLRVVEPEQADIRHCGTAAVVRGPSRCLSSASDLSLADQSRLPGLLLSPTGRDRHLCH